MRVVMKQMKLKDISVVVLFLGILYAGLALNLIKPADELSFSERRRLAQFPDINVRAVLNAESMDGFDDFAVDQFVFREQFRRLKARFDLNVWLKADNNAIFVVGDQVFKTDYPLRENSVTRLSELTNYIYAQYLYGMDVFYAIVPEKNYYLDDHRHLIIDYRFLADLARAGTNGEIGEIDLFGVLSLDSYYMTDTHWRQEKLADVVDTISQAFGSGLRFEAGGYTQMSYSPFHGVYFGQSALSVKPDEMIYLVSDVTENAVVTSIERPGTTLAVYDTGQLGGMDSYNLFMHGPQAVIRAENPLNPGAKELIIFRDSFASSLAPLLLPGYSAVKLVDLRYIRPELVGDYIDFTDQDVLFLYSSGIVNNSDSMRSPPQDAFVSPFHARLGIRD